MQACVTPLLGIVEVLDDATSSAIVLLREHLGHIEFHHACIEVFEVLMCVELPSKSCQLDALAGLQSLMTLCFRN